eukprot:scaffold658685_cov98-Prasinocladus_malaysianus.AAC.1
MRRGLTCPEPKPEATFEEFMRKRDITMMFSGQSLASILCLCFSPIRAIMNIMCDRNTEAKIARFIPVDARNNLFETL